MSIWQLVPIEHFSLRSHKLVLKVLCIREALNFGVVLSTMARRKEIMPKERSEGIGMFQVQRKLPQLQKRIFVINDFTSYVKRYCANGTVPNKKWGGRPLKTSTCNLCHLEKTMKPKTRMSSGETSGQWNKSLQTCLLAAKWLGGIERFRIWWKMCSVKVIHQAIKTVQLTCYNMDKSSQFWNGCCLLTKVKSRWTEVRARCFFGANQ